MNKLIIGARGSQMSLNQTEIIKSKIQKLLPRTTIEIKVIKTTGDKNMKPIPLDSIGKGWFTKELDKALLLGHIDLAVHSLKDLPEVLPDGLVIAGIPERDDAREVLVSVNNISFEKLHDGATIGTDSSRRQSQLLHVRPDLSVKSIRGNVTTRLAKLEKEDYDAVILAAAGLKRLELTNQITQYFPLETFIPSPGQGALAVVMKKTNTSLKNIVKKIMDQQTLIAVTAEREFSKAVGGGCKMPVGAYASFQEDKLTILGMIGSPDGKHLVKGSVTGPAVQSLALAKKLAQQLLHDSSSWYKPLIVITRPENENKEFKKLLEDHGFSVFSYPTIQTVTNQLSQDDHEKLKQIDTYDWIIFTSVKGVHFFMKYFRKQQILKTKKIAAVGPATANALKKQHLSVHFIPSKFTTEALGKEIKIRKGEKILLPRSRIASNALVGLLKGKGAEVTNIPIYNTEFIAKKLTKSFLDLVMSKRIAAIAFTSPSTIKGFIDSVKDKPAFSSILSLPILSIGPVTTKEAEKAGFSSIITADIHTTDGMIKKLKESIM